MNDRRRKRIREEVIAPLDMAMAALEEIQQEEEEYADNIPDGMEEKRERAEEMVCTMETERDNIESSKNELAEMIGDDG